MDGLGTDHKIASTPEQVMRERPKLKGPVSAFCLISLSFFLILRPLQAEPLSSYVQKADDYWLGRQNVEKVRSGIAVLRDAAGKNSGDYEVWWRISRLDSFLARHTSGSEQSRALNDGVSAGKRAVGLQPNRVEGHFWLGANEGLLA